MLSLPYPQCLGPGPVLEYLESLQALELQKASKSRIFKNHQVDTLNWEGEEVSDFSVFLSFCFILE